MPTPDSINAALEEIAQDSIRSALRTAAREGRNPAPEMFMPDHSTFAPIMGVTGAQLYVREDRHDATSNKPLVHIPSTEYGG